MKRQTLGLLVAAALPSVCSATLIPIEFERYLYSGGAYVAGSYPGDLRLPNTTDMYEYVDAATTITSAMQSVTFELNYDGAPGIYPPYHTLVFRAFAANSWRTIWGRAPDAAPYGEVRVFQFRDNQDFSLPVTISLAPYAGTSIAMGWALVSEVPTAAVITLTQIRLNQVSEPGALALLGVGLTALLMRVARRRATPNGLGLSRH